MRSSSRGSPAIAAIVSAPIAQRDTVSVTRSHTSSHRSASSGTSIWRTTSFSRFMSTSRKSARKISVKMVSPAENAWPATPITARIVSGIVDERL